MLFTNTNIMRKVFLYILLALVSVSTISCDTLVDDSQTQSDENVGCYVMKEITTNTLLDINKDGISHINMLEEFHTIPGFYVPYNKAEVIKDPYDLPDEASCYYINSQLPYPIYSDSASDVAKVAEEYDYASPGSTILDISTSNVYMLNSEGEWKQI